MREPNGFPLRPWHSAAMCRGPSSTTAIHGNISDVVQVYSWQLCCKMCVGFSKLTPLRYHVQTSPTSCLQSSIFFHYAHTHTHTYTGVHHDNATLGIYHTLKRPPQKCYDAVGLRFIQTLRVRFPLPSFGILQDHDCVYVTSVATNVDVCVSWWHHLRTYG